MARGVDAAKQLAKTISSLQSERRTHMSAVEQIDAIFRQFGIQPEQKRGPGRPPASALGVGIKPAATRGGKGSRQSFPKSGLQSIIDFVASKGAKGATTSEINQHWITEGRRGSAYVTIGQLTKKKKLKRQNLKGERGSRYTVG